MFVPRNIKRNYTIPSEFNKRFIYRRKRLITQFYF